MHKYYFPTCSVKGPIEPAVPCKHVGLRASVPQKCSECEHLSEGSCTRAFEEVGDHLHLDHGPCGIPGDTDPVYYQNSRIKAKVVVPRKCATCVYLRYDFARGFWCRKDSHEWGDIPRGLDWGTWEPGAPYYNLPAPKVTTRAMLEAATSDNLRLFVLEYRRANRDTSMLDAKDDFNVVRSKLGCC